MRGWSHWPHMAPSVGISSCHSVESGGLPSISRLKPDGKFCVIKAWGVDHTSHLRHRPLASPDVIVWKLVGQHLFLNIISFDFKVGTGGKFWCDHGTRDKLHQPLLPLSVRVSGCNSVENDGPTSISQHNPQHSHDWNRVETLVWSGQESFLRINRWPYVGIVFSIF
jgi:hypothetical protein